MLKTCDNVILLEPNVDFGKKIASAIEAHTGFCVHSVTSPLEAVAVIHDNPKSVFVAVAEFGARGVDVMLDKVAENGIPSIVFGTEFDDDIRKKISTLSIADTVVGTEESLPESVSSAVDRLRQNQSMTILVVDDSRSMRLALVRYLVTRRYKVVEAEDGVEGLALLAKHPDIRVVITDNEMPNMDGFTLVREIRKEYSKEDLAVIGISAVNNPMTSVSFINHGANDFLKKPFVKEELYSRVDNSLDMLDRIALIRDLSYKDQLTHLFNRRYFFECAGEFMDRFEEEGRIVSAAMVDIDFFKKFNDTYGHHVGDDVLCTVADTIAEHFPKDAIVSRFGGEEFCVLSANASLDEVASRHEALRQAIESSPITVGDQLVSVTVSIGVCPERLCIENMLKTADSRLYDAKESGRNRVVSS